MTSSKLTFHIGTGFAGELSNRPYWSKCDAFWSIALPLGFQH